MKIEQIDIIKKEMQKKGYSQRDLARLLEVTDNTISKWLQGKTKPTDDKVVKMAEIFAKPVSYIRGESNNLVPLLQEVQAGNWTETFAEKDDVDMVEAPCNVKARMFAVKVNGDSMTRDTPPSISEAAFCLVDPDCDKSPAELNHKVVIAKLADGRCTIKEFVFDSGAVYLRPWNNRYPVMPIDQTVLIIGRVTKTWQDL